MMDTQLRGHIRTMIEIRKALHNKDKEIQELKEELDAQEKVIDDLYAFINEQ